MSQPLDRLYDLLPQVYRQRDRDQGEPLRALLQIINEQVNLVEADITQLYDNWFIETCEAWVIPYIGALIGYRPSDSLTAAPQASLDDNSLIISRSEVANTIAMRRRKGTLAVLELLANSVAGYPARAVEFYKLLAFAQPLRFDYFDRGRTIDLRDNGALARLDTPYDRSAHTVDVRRPNSTLTPGRYNLPSVGVFIWRLKPYALTQSQAYVQQDYPNRFRFNILGIDAPLFTAAHPEIEPTAIAEALNVPDRVRRFAFAENVEAYYGVGKSFVLWLPEAGQDADPGAPVPGAPALRGEVVPRLAPIPAERIIAANLDEWVYEAPAGKILIDPEQGRIVFPQDETPQDGLWVSYYYGFGDDIGGGEYPRLLTQYEDPPAKAQPDDSEPADGLPYLYYPVGREYELNTLDEAFKTYYQERKSKGKRHAVIEIMDSDFYLLQTNLIPKEEDVPGGVGEIYNEPVKLVLEGGQTLQIRAADGARPAIEIVTPEVNAINAWTIIGKPEERDGILEDPCLDPDGKPRAPSLILDGLLIFGGGLRLEGVFSAVKIRHCTLLPSWQIGALRGAADVRHLPNHRRRAMVNRPSLDFASTTAASVEIAHSIIGSLRVSQDEVHADPLPVSISDSILDAISADDAVMADYENQYAHVMLTILRCTVFGALLVHAIIQAENCIFNQPVRVARTQIGCVRFCYVAPESRTPRRYRCQPDLALDAALEAVRKAAPGVPLDDAARAEIALGVYTQMQPRYNSITYGDPDYCQLAPDCPLEIAQRAENGTEMGVFNHLFQAQRLANLRARLAEFTPGNMDVGVIFAT